MAEYLHHWLEFHCLLHSALEIRRISRGSVVGDEMKDE